MLFKYRLLKSSWGIAIDLELFEEEYSTSISSILIGGKFYLSINNSIFLSALSKNYLILGLQEILNKNKLFFDERPIQIFIKSIIYNPVDFQDEGLYLAIQKWAKEYFHLDFEEANVIFDKENNRYVIDR